MLRKRVAEAVKTWHQSRIRFLCIVCDRACDVDKIECSHMLGPSSVCDYYLKFHGPSDPVAVPLAIANTQSATAPTQCPSTPDPMGHFIFR